MPDINEIHPYNFPASQASDFERFGNPGKWFKSITCTTGTTAFTSSNFGVGGLIVATSTVGTASLSGGGTVALGTLATTQTVHELSLSSVKVDSGTVYALVRNQVIR